MTSLNVNGTVSLLVPSGMNEHFLNQVALWSSKAIRNLSGNYILRKFFRLFKSLNDPLRSNISLGSLNNIIAEACHNEHSTNQKSQESDSNC